MGTLETSMSVDIRSVCEYEEIVSATGIGWFRIGLSMKPIGIAKTSINLFPFITEIDIRIFIETTMEVEITA